MSCAPRIHLRIVHPASLPPAASSFSSCKVVVDYTIATRLCVSLAVTAVPLLPVADELETANDLADGEETKDLGGDDSSAPVLCARCATDLAEHGIGVHGVDERGGVAEGVQRGLEVALDGLDGAGRVVSRWWWGG